MKFEFSQQIFEKVSNITKIRPVEAEMFHTDRQTDMTKLTVALRNFASALKRCQKLLPSAVRHALLLKITLF